MAKKITSTWQEALDLLSDCWVIRKPLLNGPSELLMLMEDPAGQKFILEILTRAQPGLSGNIMVVNAVFEINIKTPEPGDRFGDVVF